jgi:hypothetical protein
MSLHSSCLAYNWGEETHCPERVEPGFEYGWFEGHLKNAEI